VRHADQETIFALASGAGRAAVAVMRISGAASPALLASLCGGTAPPPRRASLRRLRGPDGDDLDRALVLNLPGPGSYTGEDSAELFLHGGRAVVDAVADALVALGARPAEPGEFTRRAFLNGRMDLTEAEGVADLIEAETQAQRRQALRQTEGALSRRLSGWADRLRLLLAEQEALIDFPDEDLPPDVEARVLAEIAALHAEMTAQLDDGRHGERLREGLVFVVGGAPNVGKSSLVNALAARDVAIVSPLPGTTRDALETRVILGGVPVTLVDTAGLRDAADAIEAEGIRRARARAAEADLLVTVCLPLSGDAVASGDNVANLVMTVPGLDPGINPVTHAQPPPLAAPIAQTTAVLPIPGTPLGNGVGGRVTPGHDDEETVGAAHDDPTLSRPAGEGAEQSEAGEGLLVVNKIDLGGAVPPNAIGVSAKTGAGLDALRDRLAEHAKRLTQMEGPPPLTRARHRAALAQAAEHLHAAGAAPWPELRAEDLRLALRALGRITGHVGVEDILDTLFSKFCIGK
jgi:tRNA U34 5-carboxymethylaminomethyl modifying GTPase MnmE/TrmE